MKEVFHVALAIGALFWLGTATGTAIAAPSSGREDRAILGTEPNRASSATTS